MSRKRDFEIANSVGKPISKKMDQIKKAVVNDGEQTRKEYKKQIDGIKNVVDIIVDDLSAQEKKELYNLNTLIDISTLEETEKRFLLELLYTLASMSDQINEAQQSFIRSVQKYLDIRNVQTMVNISCVTNIDSIQTQKAILQTIMEFLFLENDNHSYLDEYDDVFGYFSVNNKSMQDLQNVIDNIYIATGELGLIEKYGYEPGMDIISMNYDAVSDNSTVLTKIPPQIDFYIETEHYSVYHLSKLTEKSWHRVNKEMEEDNIIESLSVSQCVKVVNDRLIYADVDNIFLLNLASLEKTHLFTQRVDKMLTCDNILIYSERKQIHTYDINKAYSDIILRKEDVSESSSLIWTVGGGCVYFYDCIYDKQFPEGFICRYNLTDKTTSFVCKINIEDGFYVKGISYYNDRLYIYKNNNILSSLWGMWGIEGYSIILEMINLCNEVPFCIQLLSIKDDYAGVFSNDRLLYVKNEINFPLYSFDFIKETETFLAYGCGYEEVYHRGKLKKKVERKYFINEFYLVGDWVYFRKGRRGGLSDESELCRVAIQKPTQVETVVPPSSMEAFLKEYFKICKDSENNINVKDLRQKYNI